MIDFDKKNFRYGYEGDEWEDYQPISNCLSCVSINGNNPNCERAGT